MWIYILVSLIGFAKGGNFDISNLYSTSSNATQLCTLAEPSLSIDKTSIKVEITDAIENAVWVGYRKLETAFIYIGCVSAVGYTHTDMIPDPGICTYRCNTSYVGVYNQGKTKRCYCIEKRPQVVTAKHCNEECAFPGHILCGGKDGSKKFMSVYKKANSSTVETNPPLPVNELERCLAYEPSGHYFYWEPCGKYLRGLCKSVENGTLLPKGGGNTWRKRMQQCFEDDSTPVSPNDDMSSANDGRGQYWIGAIRSLSIVNVHIPDSGCIDGICRQGYTKPDRKLYFDSNEGNSFQALCVKGTIPTQPPTSLTPSTSPPSTSDTPSTTGSHQDTSSKSSQTHSTSSSSSTTQVSFSSTMPTKTYSEKNNKGLVALYVILPLVIVAVALAIGFIIWRRKKRLATEGNKQSHYYTDSTPIAAASNSKHPPPNQNGIAVNPESSAVRHDYFVLEPADEYAAIKDTELDNTTDGDYDTTKGATMNTNDTGNIYNRLDGDPDDTYNHTNTNTTRDEDDTYNHTNTNNTRDDDTYNHTNTGATDTTYNTTGTLSRSKQEHAATTLESDYNTLNDDDDTYNHLNGDLPKQGINPNEDDTYNHPDEEMGNPKQVAHEYSYVEPSSSNPPPPNPGRGNMKYDYAYATKGATNGSTKPAMFKIDQLPNAGSYELAKEPPTTVDYELAKPPGV